MANKSNQKSVILLELFSELVTLGPYRLVRYLRFYGAEAAW